MKMPQSSVRLKMGTQADLEKMFGSKKIKESQNFIFPCQAPKSDKY